MTDDSAFPFAQRAENKRHAPATQRNRDAITQILSGSLPKSGTMLEIASGTGEHIAHFARTFPHLRWQPSDLEEDALASIAAWSDESGAANILPPIQLNAASDQWPVREADAVLCINMLHISPWEAAIGLMRGVSTILPEDGLLFLYGPYFEEGREAAESNISFDQSLQKRNPQWGIRKLEDVCEVAKDCRLLFEQRIEMPANNLSLLFRKS